MSKRYTVITDVMVSKLNHRDSEVRLIILLRCYVNIDHSDH